MRTLRSLDLSPAETQTLDLGAGRGSLSKKLYDDGFKVRACDMFPDEFEFEPVDCLGVDANGRLPYKDGSFDLVLAVEVVEHIERHGALFSEVARTLKPGGLFLFTTPNMNSLKSRMLFLFTGYFYSFPTLDPGEVNPVGQHISPYTVDRYKWMLAQSGLELTEIRADKYQSSSLFWRPLAPLIRWYGYRKQGRSDSVKLQNSPNALYGRKLIGICRRCS
jgi:SAM-dependent methyltransferase